MSVFISLYNFFIDNTTYQETTEILSPAYAKDFQHVIGHKRAKRALEIAAAGGHHVLMIGPPGCGKSLLSETFPSILPPLKQDGQFEVMSIDQSGITCKLSNPAI